MTDTVSPGGAFVVFEGLDGSGTTTQTRRLAGRLQTSGRRAWLTSEPTERPIGLLARSVLAGEFRVSPETVAHIFAADRSDHLLSPGGIRERVAAGELVICDRYKYSSLAYQTIEADASLVERLNTGFDDPDIVLFLDLPVAAVEERLAGRSRRDIYERLEFQEQVRARYLDVLATAGARVPVVRIDATEPEETIAEKIWETLVDASILGV